MSDPGNGHRGDPPPLRANPDDRLAPPPEPVRDLINPQWFQRFKGMMPGSKRREAGPTPTEGFMTGGMSVFPGGSGRRSARARPSVSLYRAMRFVMGQVGQMTVGNFSSKQRQAARYFRQEGNVALDKMTSFNRREAKEYQTGLAALAIHAKERGVSIDLSVIENGEQLKQIMLQARVSRKAIDRAKMSVERQIMLPKGTLTLREVANQFKMTDPSEEVAILAARAGYKLSRAMRNRSMPPQDASVDGVLADIEQKAAHSPYLAHHERVSEHVRHTFTGIHGTKRLKDVIDGLVAIDPSLAKGREMREIRTDMRALADTGLKESGRFMQQYGNQYGKAVRDMVPLSRMQPADKLVLARINDFVSASITKLHSEGKIDDRQGSRLVVAADAAISGTAQFIDMLDNRNTAEFTPPAATAATPGGR
ncbi:MAG: hypothetical protein KI792_01670 [Alphaproteobacteria bacterium]|nr:hypothetical protein [Alphaproteobacteria bacterium SS10]